jgi:hypothetical protein
VNRKLALLLASALLAAGCGDAVDGSGDISDAQYFEWRKDCEAQADRKIRASDGQYRIGGDYWVESVNNCLEAKATD